MFKKPVPTTPVPPQEALIDAILKGSLKDINLALQNGADVNGDVPDVYDFPEEAKGLKPLMVSLTNKPNKFDMVKLLIEKGADVNAQLDDGYSALFAVTNYMINLDAIRLLIEKGADVNVSRLSNVKKRASLLNLVCYNTRKLNDDSFLLWDTEYMTELIKLLIEKGADVNSKEEHVGDTPLIIINKSSYYDEVIKLLIEKGADVNAKNKDGFTPLIDLARNYSLDASLNTVKLLVEKGADVNAKDLIKQRTPFEWIMPVKSPLNVKIRDFLKTRTILEWKGGRRTKTHRNKNKKYRKTRRQ